jgi:hypothetical protein
VDTHPDVLVLGEQRLTRVDSHSDRQAQIPLRRRRRGYGVLRACESDEERIALSVDLGAAVLRERVAEHPPMLFEKLRVGVPMRAQQRS